MMKPISNIQEHILIEDKNGRGLQIKNPHPSAILRANKIIFMSLRWTKAENKAQGALSQAGKAILRPLICQKAAHSTLRSSSFAAVHKTVPKTHSRKDYIMAKNVLLVNKTKPCYDSLDLIFHHYAHKQPYFYSYYTTSGLIENIFF